LYDRTSGRRDIAGGGERRTDVWWEREAKRRGRCGVRDRLHGMQTNSPLAAETVGSDFERTVVLARFEG